MRGGAMALGLIGGIIGLFGSGFALAVGGIGGGLARMATGPQQVQLAEQSQYVIAAGWIALGASFVGIVGAALSLGSPRWAAALMVLSGAVGLLAVWAAYWIAGPLLIFGGLLALAAPRTQKPASI